jgi:type I restriction enzyme M protein
MSTSRLTPTENRSAAGATVSAGPSLAVIWAALNLDPYGVRRYSGSRPFGRQRRGTDIVLNGYSDRVNLIWQIADFLRGDYKQSEYGKVVLPLVVLRRLDCVLADTKPAVLAEAASLEGQVKRLDPMLTKVAGHSFYNTSPWDFDKLLGDPENLATNLRMYIGGFSEGAAEVLSRFGFDEQINRLDNAFFLYLVVGKFAAVDLHPNVVKNHEMGAIYEELIRKFSEQSNETAGEHFTPREVIRLMVALLFEPDREVLANGHQRRTLYDPTCGTGGMLSVAEDYLMELNEVARLEVFGQELNDETYAICRSDMMLKGQDPSHIAVGNTLTKDAFPRHTFNYCLSNPPFGVDWKKVEPEVRLEAADEGDAGRFRAGLPRVDDGQLIFIQHMLSKMAPLENDGSRMAIVFNGGPLFAGGAGSGESEIRRWIIENDWLETIVALPDQLFYNTPLSTYIWLVTNRKQAHRRGTVQLIDARHLSTRLKKSLGEKRKEMTPAQIEAAVEIYKGFGSSEHSRVVQNHELGYLRATVERPLRVRYDLRPGLLADLTSLPVWETLPADDQSAIEACLSSNEGLSTTVRATMAKVLPALSKPAAKLLWDTLTVRDASAPVVQDTKGKPTPDVQARNVETVPMPAEDVDYSDNVADRLASSTYREAVESYMQREVVPYLPDAWVDHSRTKIGYEIPLTQYFYSFAPARPVTEIEHEIRQIEDEIRALLDETFA